MRFNDIAHNNAFPESYYAATCNDLKPFSTLEEDQRVDVCIVGGGFTGVAAALHLSERGFKVALVEQNHIGWGASGRNGGQVIGGYSRELANVGGVTKLFGKENTKKMWQMGVECIDIIADWVEKYDINCNLKWGYFDAAMKQSELDELKRSRDTLVDMGFQAEQRLIENRDEMAKIVNSDRYIGGLANMGWGHCHVLNLIRGEARAAEGLGAKIYEGAMVTDIEYGEPAKVKTETATITADFVLMAGNAYMGNLVPKLASRLIPAGSYIIATEPLSDEQIAQTLPSDYAICDLRWALDYYRLSSDNRLLFGGLANYSGRHPKDIASTLIPKMEKVFPELKGIKIDYEWGGYMGIGMNRIPQIGRVTPNVYFAQAYSGHGVASTHMSAKLVSEAIAGHAERFDVMANVMHPPFPGGRLLRQPILAAGMMFYKMRDELGI